VRVAVVVLSVMQPHALRDPLAQQVHDIGGDARKRADQ
jgi:hypothetical protein